MRFRSWRSLLHEEGPSVADDLDVVPEPAFAIDLSHQANIDEAAADELDAGKEPKMSADKVSVFYGDKQALKDISIKIYDDRVTAFIGPSGCGKSTFLRTLNRMGHGSADVRTASRDGPRVTTSRARMRMPIEVVGTSSRSFCHT